MKMCEENEKTWSPTPVVDEPFADVYDDPRVVVETDEEENRKG